MGQEVSEKGLHTNGIWLLCIRKSCHNNQGRLELNVQKLYFLSNAYNYTTNIPLLLTLMVALTMTGTPTTDASNQMHTLMTLALPGVRKSSALTG